MKTTNTIHWQSFTDEDMAKIIKNSPSLQEHLAETRKLFSRIPKEALAKVVKR